MGRPFNFAPPEQVANANTKANLPDPIELPNLPEPGMPDLAAPTFPELNLPEASGAAMADLPDIPAFDLPDVFGI